MVGLNQARETFIQILNPKSFKLNSKIIDTLKIHMIENIKSKFSSLQNLCQKLNCNLFRQINFTLTYLAHQKKFMGWIELSKK